MKKKLRLVILCLYFKIGDLRAPSSNPLPREIVPPSRENFRLGIPTIEKFPCPSMQVIWLTIEEGSKLHIRTRRRTLLQQLFKFCRFIGSNKATATNSVTVCTFKQPFVVQVHFDGSEVVDTIAINKLTTAGMANERFGSGTVGFLLQFAQTT